MYKRQSAFSASTSDVALTMASLIVRCIMDVFDTNPLNAILKAADEFGAGTSAERPKRAGSFPAFLG